MNISNTKTQFFNRWILICQFHTVKSNTRLLPGFCCITGILLFLGYCSFSLPHWKCHVTGSRDRCYHSNTLHAAWNQTCISILALAQNTICSKLSRSCLVLPHICSLMDFFFSCQATNTHLSTHSFSPRKYKCLKMNKSGSCELKIQDKLR